MARNIRRLRIARLLSQETLAIAAGIDRTYVSPLERGLENPIVPVPERRSRLFAAPKLREKLPATLPNGQNRLG